LLREEVKPFLEPGTTDLEFLEREHLRRKGIHQALDLPFHFLAGALKVSYPFVAIFLP
jgi:hypothetical protein